MVDGIGSPLPMGIDVCMGLIPVVLLECSVIVECGFSDGMAVAKDGGRNHIDHMHGGFTLVMNVPHGKNQYAGVSPLVAMSPHVIFETGRNHIN